MKSRLFFVFILLFQFQVYAKRKVCTVTINSSDEKEIFTKNLDPNKFDFIELTTVGQKNQNEGGEAWLDRACAEGIQCDVLIVSGHFGGTFFGKNEANASLAASTLERKSCEKTCEGILKNPKEVFLFGCNTLAKKNKDRRTPDEYRRVLIDDGIDAQTAERVVQARYGALGSSFHDQMRRVFQDVPIIHGFDSIGPAGKTVRPFLNKFFATSEVYDKRLDRIEAEKLIGLIEKTNSKLGQINGTFSKVFSNTAYTFCSGLQTTDPQFQHKEKICQLFDMNKTTQEREEIARQMLLDPDRLMYLPMVSDYFERNYVSENFKEKMAGDIQIKTQLAEDNELLIGSPLTYIEVLNLRKKLGFISKDEHSDRTKMIVKNIINQLNREGVDAFCSFNEKLEDPVQISWADIPISQRNSRHLPALVNCIEKPDLETKKGALKASKQLPDLDRLSTYYSLSGTKELRSELYTEILKTKKLTNPEYEKHRQALISKLHPSDTEALRAAEKFANDKDMTWITKNILEDRNLSSPQIQKNSLNKLLDEKTNSSEIYENFQLYLAAGKPSTEEITTIFKQEKVVQDHSNLFYSMKEKYDQNKLDRSIITHAIASTPSGSYPGSVLDAYADKEPLDVTERAILFRALTEGRNTATIRSILMTQDTSQFSLEEKNLLKGQYLKCQFVRRGSSCSSYTYDGQK